MINKKVWLITGAGRRLGVDIARAVLATGHAVVAAGADAVQTFEAKANTLLVQAHAQLSSSLAYDTP